VAGTVSHARPDVRLRTAGLELSAHHAASIANVVRAFEADGSTQALILGGSLAHGYARPDSDIDVLVVVDADEYQRRASEGRLVFTDRTLATYEGGYVDGKYVDARFLERVAAHGSDPARYAFQDARILSCRIDGLPQLLAACTRYPVEEAAERISRFTAQLMAWRWYFGESARQQDRYLEVVALHKLVLFACRLVLAANERLYPYHKWLRRETERATRRPPGLMGDIDQLLAQRTVAVADGLCRDLLAFYDIDEARANASWPGRFLQDTELAWMSGHPAIDDV
jgi:predicted nucleotidyltransferase